VFLITEQLKTITIMKATTTTTSTITTKEYNVEAKKAERKPAKEFKRIIYSTDYDVEDSRESYIEFCKDNDIEPTEEGLIDYANTDNNDWLNCERYNLSRRKMHTKFLIIASLGLWNGRRSGYKIMNVTSLNDIFNIGVSSGSATFYYDKYDLKVENAHHDGVNYLTIREIKPGKELALQRLCDKLYNNEEVKSNEITYCTKSLKPIFVEIYGR
jgi:hypothetical protein